MNFLRYTIGMNIGILLFIAIASLWALGVFFGNFVKFPKTFTQTPSAADTSSIEAQEQRKIDETEAKRQQMMVDIKQKMQDAQEASHKY